MPFPGRVQSGRRRNMQVTQSLARSPFLTPSPRFRTGATPLSLAIGFHDGGRNPQYDDVIAYLRSVGAPTWQDLDRLAAHAADAALE